MDPKGKGLLIAIGKSPKAGPPEPEGEPDGDEGMDAEFNEYADQMMQAVQEDDAESFRLALRGAISSCNY